MNLNKLIIPALVGIESAKIRRDELFTFALSHLKKADCCSEHLLALSRYIIERNY
jgi:hypothetical protein